MIPHHCLIFENPGPISLNPKIERRVDIKGNCCLTRSPNSFTEKTFILKASAVTTKCLTFRGKAKTTFSVSESKLRPGLLPMGQSNFLIRP